MKTLTTNIEECLSVGETLKKLKYAILITWESEVRNCIHKMKHENTIILQDHILAILDQMGVYLTTGHIDDEDLGKAHGFQRAILTKASLNDILQEYSILRSTLIDYLYPMGDLDCTKTVHRYIDMLCKHSMLEFLNHPVDAPQVKVEVKEVKKVEVPVPKYVLPYGFRAAM